MTMVRFLFAFLVGLSLHVVCFAQNDTIRVQDLHPPPAKKKHSRNLYATDSVTLSVHSPRRATLYSTFLPGLGQIYNRKYWKVPIVWAAVGIPAYTYFYNKDWYNKCQRAISLLDIYVAKGLPYPINNPDSMKLIDSKLWPFIIDEDENSMRTYRNEYRKDEDYSVLFFFLFWGLNIVDATVDAHLMSFDVSNSLTLKLDQPSGGVSVAGPGGTGMGLSLVLDWHKARYRPLRLQ